MYGTFVAAYALAAAASVAAAIFVALGPLSPAFLRAPLVAGLFIYAARQVSEDAALVQPRRPEDTGGVRKHARATVWLLVSFSAACCYLVPYGVEGAAWSVDWSAAFALLGGALSLAEGLEYCTRALSLDG